MKTTRSSLASRLSVSIILCLTGLMVLMASVISVSPNSSLATASLATSARVEASAIPSSGEPIAPMLGSPLAPVANVTATKTHTPSGNRAPGDTLTYTVVITNNLGIDALGVNFTDTIDPNTTLVLNSLKVSPIAVNDTYNTIGNVNISLPAASGLLANDLNPGGMGTLGFTLINATPFVTGTAVATTHGSVTVNTDGSFTYTPTAGYAGPSDSFTYTLGNGTGLTDTATVTINISGMIWFVDNSPGAPGSAPGDGRLNNPFRSFGGASSFSTLATDAVGDTIFIYTGTSNYTGGVTLLNTQKLIGQGAGASLLSITGYSTPSGTNLLPATGGTNPTISAATANITLGSGNTVRGVNLNGSAAAASNLNGTSFGTLTLAETAISGTGRALNLTTGTLSGPVSSTAAFTSISSTGSSTTGISLTGVGGIMSSGSTTIATSTGIGISIDTSSATFNLNNTTSVTNSGAAGVSLTTNTGTITFATLNITNTTSNKNGLVATNNTNTLTVTGGAINAGSLGPAVQITRSSGTTPLVISLASVAASGGTEGVVLTNTSGSFTIVGDGSNTNNSSGGTIQNSTNNGITLSNAQNISLTSMNIQSSAHSGIYGSSNVQNFSFVKGTINNSGTASGTGDSNIAFNNGEFSGNTGVNKNISGTLTITGSTLNNAYYSGLDVYQFDGTISNANISNNSLTSSTNITLSKSTAILLQCFGSASTVSSITKGAINSNVIANFPSNAGIFVTGGNATCANVNCMPAGAHPTSPAGTYGADATTNIISINSNTITGQASPNQMGTQGIVVTLNGKGTGFFSANSNSITNVKGNGIQPSAFGLTTLTMFVIGNTINAHNIAASQGIGAGTGNSFLASDTPTLNIKIGDGTMAGLNDISNTDGNGILIVARSASGHVNARVLMNKVSTPIESPPSGTTYGIRVDAGNNPSVDDAVCLEISGNTTSGNNDGMGTHAPGIGLRKQGIATTTNDFGIVGMAATATPNVEAFVNGQNPGSASGSFGVGGTALISAQSGFSNCTEPAGLAFHDVATASAGSGVTTTSLQNGGTDDSSESAGVLRTLVAHNGKGPGGDSIPRLSQAELAWMIQAALERWRQFGITPEEQGRLQAVTFELASLPDGQLATAASTHITVDETGAGYGWYFDQTPMEDSEFDVPVPNKELQTTEFSPAFGRMDLLTVLMRELGIVYLQGKTRVPKQLRPLMEIMLSPSVRRLPDPSAIQIQRPEPPAFTTQSQNAPAQDSSQQTSSSTGRRAGIVGITGNLSPQSGETVTQALGTIPVNEGVTIQFQVTINDPLPPNVCTVTNPAPGSGVNVTGTNFTSVTIAADPATIVKAPTIGTCPANISKNTDPNVCTAVATFTTPTSDACPGATVTCNPASGFAFVKGTTTVTCTAANGVLPNATCTFTVTVTDAQAPVLSGCTNQTINTAAGVCTATATYTPTATDNCDGSRPVTCVPASGSTFNKGVTTVNCSASDLAAPPNTGTCTFTITVNDNQAPVLSGCTNITTVTAPGVCTAAPTYAPTATDNCDGVRPVTCVPASGSTFTKGVTTVNCSASDLNTPTPNTGTCSFTVTVNDNQAPVLSGCTNITTNTGPGVCTAAPTYAPTATDNCDGSRPVTCVPASGSTFNKGVTTVTCSASDLATPTANTGMCSFTVTVNDNQPPVLTGCTNQIINTGAGVCTAMATFTVTATDNCDGVRPVTCVPASGATFQKGVTTVSCSASDLNAPPNTGMCTFTITVNDTQPPVVTCPPSGGAFAASDCLPSQRSAYTGATLYSVGPNTVTNAVLSGFTPCTPPPVSGTANINFTGILTGDLTTGGPPTHFQAPVTGSMKVTFNNLTGVTRTFDTEMLQLDLSGGNLPAGVQLRESPTLVSTGQTKITTVTGGFHIDSFFDVFTELTTNGGLAWTPDPAARHIAAVQSTDAGACNAVVNYADATATDNCPGLPAVTCSPLSGSSFAKGVTTVSCSVTDLSGNPGACSFTVTVLDTQLPTLTCPSNINVIGNTCQNVSYSTPVPSDNCPGPTVLCAPLPGTCFAVGTTTVTCTATDMSANTAQCTFTVTVTPCTITCPNNVSVDAEPGMCSAIATFDPPTTTGSCGTVTCVPASGSPFQKGVTTVTCSTAAGPSCSFTVTVNDTQPPTITCPLPVVHNTDPNVCTAVVTFADPTVTDNCPPCNVAPPKPGQSPQGSGCSVVCVPASGATFQKGVTTVTCTATDASNNMAQCMFTVTVNDTQAPAITCPLPVVQSTDPNVCTALVTYSNATATDNCPGVGTPVCTPASGTTFQKGVTTVSCSVSDASKNSSNCTFTVTINDTQPPTVTCPLPIIKSTDPNVCTAVVTFADPVVTDNCPPCDNQTKPGGKSPLGPPGGCSVVCVPASGSTFQKGVTTVTCTATDASNNTAMCSFTVTVNDTQAPSITCPTPITQNADPNACTAVVNFTPTATDNCPLGPTPIVCTPASGTTFQKGVTTVSCTATDTSTNTASCTFTVTINDTQAPSITCPANISQPATAGQCSKVVTYTNATATDNCPGVGTPSCVPASGATFQKGVTTVTCTVNDASNNQASCTFTVTITDTQPPVITCPANVIKGTDPNVCTAVVTYSNATATDNCPGVGTPVCTPASGTTFQKGVTTVSCTVSDASKNSANCTFTVTVNDTQNPSVTCPANITFTTPGFNDPCGVVTYATPAGSDNCPLGPNPVSCTPASGTCFPVGMTTVTCTVTDTSNNHGTCTFKITVQNPCTITCPANITKNNDANQCGAVVTFAPTTTGGGCGTVACSPASGAFFPKGTTTVTCTTTAGPSCSFTVTVNDTQPPNITCPANVVHGTDPNVCQAVVTYPAPVVTDNCPGVGAPSCVPASGSTFPKGTTTVTCTVKDAVNNMSMCSFTVTVNDTQPPVFPNGCPAGITKALQATCPFTTSTTVTYTTPIATDNCPPAPTVVCNPPSGSVFPTGTTMITCTATDSSGNTATCSFPVNIYTFCLQDDSTDNNVVFVNMSTGDYLFCQNGVPIASGTGTFTVHGCNFQLDHTKGDRKVHIQGDTAAASGAGAGTAYIQKLGGGIVVLITDRRMVGDTCTCSPGVPPPAPSK